MLNFLPKDARPCANTYIVNVTPEQARQWLEINNFNRPKNFEAVAKYVRQIREGRWRLTHQGLAFTKNGMLLDGQHRLWAIIECGITLPMRVCINEPAENYEVIDCGRNYLEFEYTVLDGEQKGSLHWDRLCLEHPNPKAIKRANAALSAICHSVGVMNFRDTVELHHLPFQITVKNRTDNEGRVTAEIAGYAPRPTFAGHTTNPDATAKPGANRPSGTDPGSVPWGKPSR